MATNIGFDDGHPFAEDGADEGVVFQDGARFAVAAKGEETSPPLTVTVNGGVTVEPAAATLTPLPDMNPVPRVLVDVPMSAFPVGAVTVSLTRTAEGRTFDVRGGQRKPATSPLIVLDPEAPFGVESAYTVVGHDAAGSVVGSWPVGTTTLGFDGTVIQQPLDPRLSVQVTLLLGTAAPIVRETPGSLAYPQGRVLPGMVGLGPRRGIQGTVLEILVTSAVEADRLQATLGTYEVPQLPIWLVRTSGGRLPRVFFCHVPRLEERDLAGGVEDLLQFSAVVTEGKPPAAGITAAVLTWSDVKVFYSTWTELKAAYATWSDLKRDTSLIGAAG